MTNKTHRTRRLVSLVLAVLVCAGLWWSYANRQYLDDYVKFSAYQPTDEIEQMAERVGLTESGKFRTYSAAPEISQAAEFNEYCGSAEAETNVLGCYTGEKIYVFDVKSSELDGIKEVTLVHEMLHADYARQSGGERQELDKAIDQYVGAHGDKALEEHMSSYPAADKYTELHSVLGTEYSGLPDVLEKHYSALFSRAKVLALYDGYQQKFEEIQTRADEIVREGEALADDIKQQSAAYDTALDELNARIKSFNARAGTSGGFSSQAEFDAERASLVAESGRLEALRVEINQKIERYNVLAEELSQLELRNRELNDSLNSKLQEAPTL
ncbi:MAG: hypothetical protein LBL84_01845 [Candidatus Nomurabacteria bacterium]|jgi:nitrogen fixation-related uncharacterized protein|nr:hypothetical protein [Candidatus Nomurabacteria bacterium]